MGPPGSRGGLGGIAPPEKTQQALGQLDLALVQEQVGGVGHRGDLAADRLDDGRMGVPERAHRDPRDQVQVLAPVQVPHPAPRPAADRHRGHAVVRHDRGREPLLQCFGLAHPDLAGSFLRDNHGADAGIGEDLEQDGVAEAAVQDVSLRDAAAHRGQAGLHLGDHPGREPGQQPLQFRRGELADHLGRRRPVPVQPGHVGEHHELGRAERHRERGRGGVRVHVVDLAVPARGHAGDDRNPAVGQQRLDGTAVGGHDLADHADVHRLTVDDRRLADRGERAGVFARHAHGERAVPVDQPHDVLVHLAGQDHPDDLHGFRRGDPEAGGEGGLHS